MDTRRVIIIGGGLAGLSAAKTVAEKGIPVDLFSIVKVKRSHSVCAQGGINAAIDPTGEGDSPYNHFYETIYGGDFLANQTPVKEMCEAAPEIIYMMDRMGVMFNRTPEGHLDFRRFGGSKFHRTAFAGATTGQQLVYALDEQVRKHEAAGLVWKYEGYEFLSLVWDQHGVAKGIIAINRETMEISFYKADAVINCSGGPGLIYGKSTNSVINVGSVNSMLFQQGAKYANPEFIQIHPTAIPGEDKLRLISESVRGEGGRVWTWKDGKKWYFLEEWYPEYGNLVPRDIASRAIYKVCNEMGLGIDGKNQVCLDITHLDPDVMENKIGGVLDIYRKFAGEEPLKVPMKVYPAYHYSMGGIWVDYDQKTSIEGVYAAGECDYQYHGANRLGANSLLSCIFSGLKVGKTCCEYIAGLETSSDALKDSIFEDVRAQEIDRFKKIFAMNGKQNPYQLHRELGELMTRNVSVERFNDKLAETDEQLKTLSARWKDVGLSDHSPHANHTALFINHLRSMLVLARVITVAALNRDESRGAHYKPDFPDRDDEHWLKTTIATYDNGEIQLCYEDVDLQHVEPTLRTY